jgi:hypothetical protein
MTLPANTAANSSGSSPRVSTASSEASDFVENDQAGPCDPRRRKSREKMLRQARIAVGEDSDRPAVRSAADAFSIESVSGMRRNFLFRRTLSIARHRLVDLASPGIDAAVEADCVVKAGVSEKVDDHLTASPMMANDYQ